jgi:hypothetical protein
VVVAYVAVAHVTPRLKARTAAADGQPLARAAGGG